MTTTAAMSPRRLRREPGWRGGFGGDAAGGRAGRRVGGVAVGRGGVVPRDADAPAGSCPARGRGGADGVGGRRGVPIGVACSVAAGRRVSPPGVKLGGGAEGVRLAGARGGLGREPCAERWPASSTGWALPPVRARLAPGGRRG
ncbi:hypothetical protein [Pengzhenrongella frigida]|uniref:hypothetical protein n=1 Tax=Pengzhenrongella frigida TaxID=1259133 RepID=UPI001F5C601E|nr:hypothetical protein [Cellulomonas sp. HLT2-17]